MAFQCLMVGANSRSKMIFVEIWPQVRKELVLS